METKTLLYKWKAAQLLAGQNNNQVSSSIMGSFIDSLSSLRTTVPKLSSAVCQQCNSVLLPDNHTVRFISHGNINKKKRGRKHKKRSKIHTKHRRQNETSLSKCLIQKINCKCCSSITKHLLESNGIRKVKQSAGTTKNGGPTCSSSLHLSQNLATQKTSGLNSPSGSPKMKRKSSGFVKKLSQLLNNSKSDKNVHKNVNNNSLLDDFLTSL